MASSGPAATAFIASAVFLALVAAVAAIGFMPIAVLWLYLALSALAFGLYALDKSAARKGGRRTPESTLHAVSLFGGWPGALFAQQLLRHKSSKGSFRAVFWLTLAANISALLYLSSPHGSWARAMLDRIAS